MINISALWGIWSGPLWAVGGAVGVIIRARLQRERNHLDATAQALALVEASKRTISQLNASAERSLAFEMAARVRDVSSLDALADLHVLAISARLRCHDVEYRAGLALTEFPPFPAFPAKQVPPSALVDEPKMTGAAAADTAEPGAKTTHE
ncbi:hypothetical protein [Asaia sp. HN010]|uniref:hypothetical protein n=1 Tax=Asaia sp. HN010 TaxID=3081233 RepID=UPI003016AA1B